MPLQVDLLFIKDATGSQQPYINATRDKVNQIVTNMQNIGEFQHPGDLRLGLIAFRDHPPQETSFVTQSYGFTDDVATFKNHLSGLVATGGGDGPEAQCDALEDALNASWRADAAKIVMLITDAPPHGLEPTGDAFPGGCPLGKDPLATAEKMADRHIIVNVVGCEPALTSYIHGLRFYKGIATKTGGKYIPLTNAEHKPLEHAFTGLAMRSLDSARLHDEHADAIYSRVFVDKHDVHDVVTDLHNHLSTKGVEHHDVFVDDVYESNADGEANEKIWVAATSIKQGKDLLVTAKKDALLPHYTGGATADVSYAKRPIERDHVHTVVSRVVRTGARKQGVTADNVNDLITMGL